MLKIDKIQLKANATTVNGLFFKPEESKLNNKTFAIFTHGFTASKTGILNWAARVCEEGVPCIIFDQPGHYLGSYNEVESFDVFKEDAPKLFQKAYTLLKEEYQQDSENLVIGGHSLGALTSLIALERNYFNNSNLLCMCVGFGLPPQGTTHIFASPMYKSTLNLRGQLVSEHLSPDVVFPWIKEKKQNLAISNQRIHFITGEDDVVVGKDGSELLVESLSKLSNQVTIDKPKKLPHHEPGMAAGHLKKFIKDQGFFK